MRKDKYNLCGIKRLLYFKRKSKIIDIGWVEHRLTRQTRIRRKYLWAKLYLPKIPMLINSGQKDHSKNYKGKEKGKDKGKGKGKRKEKEKGKGKEGTQSTKSRNRIKETHHSSIQPAEAKQHGSQATNEALHKYFLLPVYYLSIISLFMENV